MAKLRKPEPEFDPATLDALIGARRLMSRRENAVAAAALAVVSAAVMARELGAHAVFSCLQADTVAYFNWVRQVADSFASGVLLPRWMPDAHGAYGSPAFVFYAPLLFYVTAAVKLVTGDPLSAMALAKVLGLFLSGLFTYAFVKDLWGFRAAVVASLVYILLPYRIFDLYFLGTHASKFALVWFPLILFFCNRAVHEEKLGRGTAGLAVSYALLCLTHLLPAYMFTPVLVGFGLVIGRERLSVAAARVALGCVLGLALAAFYLIPVMIERPWVHFDILTKLEIFHYSKNFLFSLFAPRSPPNPMFYGGLARIILVSTVFAASFYTAAAVLKKQPVTHVEAFFVACAAVPLFLMSSLSSFVWAHVPGMKMLQFPTRWSAVLVFALACLAGAGTHRLKFSQVNSRRGALLLVPVLAALLLCLRYDAKIIANACKLTESELGGGFRWFEVNEYVPATVSLDWLSENAYKNIATPASSSDAGATVAVNRWDPARRVLTISASRATTLRIRTFYYPGWRGYIDANESPLIVEGASGAILMRVPDGDHRVILTFGNTPDRRIGILLSVLAILVVVMLAGRGAARVASVW
jgi:hypothetical protein